MSLEELLNQTNSFYEAQGIAFIHKKPTPVQVVQVDYKSRATAKITEAYYTTPSTTDYNGVYRGYYIDFEAKQTNLPSLPFHNFHSHQIEHMNNVLSQNGICFVIIYYKKAQKVYLIPAQYITTWYKDSFTKKDARKSISLKMAETHGTEISSSGFPSIDYLPTLETIIGGTSIEK